MTDAPTLDLAEIKRLAEAASSGSWQWAVGPALASMEAEDAAFVQAVSPAVVLALLSRLDAAEQGRDRLRVVAEAAEKMADEFGCSLDMLNRHGPVYTMKDGTQVLEASILSDRADIIERCRTALAALRAPEPKE